MQKGWLLSSNNIIFIDVQKSLMRGVRRTSKLWQNNVQLIAVRKQTVRSLQMSYQFLSVLYKTVLVSLPYNKHLINRAWAVCMGESWPRSLVKTSLRSVCTHDLGQDSPIQTSLYLPACQKLWSTVACPVEPLPLVTGLRFVAEQLPMEKVGSQCI